MSIGGNARPLGSSPDGRQIQCLNYEARGREYEWPQACPQVVHTRVVQRGLCAGEWPVWCGTALLVAL